MHELHIQNSKPHDLSRCELGREIFFRMPWQATEEMLDMHVTIWGFSSRVYVLKEHL